MSTTPTRMPIHFPAVEGSRSGTRSANLLAGTPALRVASRRPALVVRELRPNQRTMVVPLAVTRLRPPIVLPHDSAGTDPTRD